MRRRALGGPATEKPIRRRHYYGWVVVGALAGTETVSWGVLYYAFSVFLDPMRAELGWSTAAMTGAYSLALLVAGLAAVPVGRWLDRHGPRALMTSGSILATLLLLAWSIVDRLAVFYLIWAGIGLAMAATLYEPAFTTVTVWFERRRNRALLLLTVVAGFASTIFLPVANGLVGWLGWRGALVALAAILAVTTIPPHALLLRRRPEDLGLQPDGGVVLTAEEGRPAVAGVSLRRALRDPAFWWLTLAFSLGTFSSVAVGVHLIPFLTGRGFSPGFAAAVTGLIGATQVAARVIVTVLHHRWRQAAVTSVVFALQAFALVLLLWWQTATGVIVAVVLLGVGRGAVTLARASLIGDLYGRAHYGAISGTLALFVTLARAAAPVGVGLAHGWWSGYPPVFWGLAALSGLASLAILGVGGHDARTMELPPA